MQRELIFQLCLHLQPAAFHLSAVMSLSKREESIKVLDCKESKITENSRVCYRSDSYTTRIRSRVMSPHFAKRALKIR